MEEIYLSIKEFSGRAGVSPQAVYQRIDKDLKEHFKLIEGKKALSVKALDLFVIQPSDQPVDQSSGQAVDQTIEDDLAITLKETLNLLTGQLAEKDKQIAELNERLKESNELNRNNQILIGRQQEQPKQIEEIQHVQEPEKRSLWSRLTKRTTD